MLEILKTTFVMVLYPMSKTDEMLGTVPLGEANEQYSGLVCECEKFTFPKSFDSNIWSTDTELSDPMRCAECHKFSRRNLRYCGKCKKQYYFHFRHPRQVNPANGKYWCWPCLISTGHHNRPLHVVYGRYPAAPPPPSLLNVVRLLSAEERQTALNQADSTIADLLKLLG